MKKAILFFVFTLVLLGGYWYGKRIQPPPTTPPTPPPTATVVPTPTTEPIGPSLVECEPPQFTDDLQLPSLMRALGQSLKYYEGLPETKMLSFGKDDVYVGTLKTSIQAVLEGLDRWGLEKEFFEFLRNDFRWYKANIDSVLFTGYYLASLRGSRKKTKKYRYPLYRRPHDLCRVYLKDFPFFQDFPGLPRVIRGRLTDKKRIVPYYTRTEIDYRHKLDGKDLELLWVDSAVDRFFLQVQGSGIVTFEDGSNQRVNYADSSGHTYQSIGKHLIALGILTEETVSMKTIRAYLEKNPKEVRKILTHDPSYVFFRLVDDVSLWLPRSTSDCLSIDCYGS